LAFLGQNDVAWLSRLRRPDGHDASIRIEIRNVHRCEFGIAAPCEQGAANEIAKCGLAGINEPDAFCLGEITKAGCINTLEWFRAAPRVVTHDVTGLPGVIERGFQDSQDTIGSCASATDRLGASVALAVLLLLARLGADAGGLLGKTLVPILDFSGREFGDGGIAERGQDMCVRGKPRSVSRLAATALIRG